MSDSSARSLQWQQQELGRLARQLSRTDPDRLATIAKLQARITALKSQIQNPNN